MRRDVMVTPAIFALALQWQWGQTQDDLRSKVYRIYVQSYISKNFPEYIGEIVYLFVFRELIDAYENREIPHPEWIKFLDVAGYKKTQYFLSCETVDIARIIIEGLIGLIIIHRDHVPDNFPLLPWYHSTEPCEHTFGNSRKIVKDFTMLDFSYMIPKLRITMRQAYKSLVISR
ncbi:hypothetical protein B0H13DRAFT_1857467 [Mycena leptocephala]|nr:hypothetical protein B0H13DRAFT_1857467 [Mycena leptocephala]